MRRQSYGVSRRNILAQDPERTAIVQEVLLLLISAVIVLLCGAAHSVQLGQQAIAGPSCRAELQRTAVARLSKQSLPLRCMWSTDGSEGGCGGIARRRCTRRTARSEADNRGQWLQQQVGHAGERHY